MQRVTCSWVLVWIVFLLGVSATVRSAAQTEPAIEVSPATLDFGEAPVGSDATRSLTVHNAGRSPLAITRFEVTSRTSPFYPFCHTGILGTVLQPQETETVDVCFVPDVEGEFEDTLVIGSTDPNRSVVAVLLRGRTGSTGPSPLLNVAPVSIDFGGIAAGSRAKQQLTLRNVGTADMVIAALVISASPFGAIPPPASLGVRFPPGQMMAVEVTFSPHTTGRFTGSLVIYSNNPVDSQLTVPLRGTASRRELSSQSCEVASLYRSGSGRAATSIEFANHSAQAIQVYWIDYQGQHRPYATLRPGQSYVQGTYVTHLWLVTDTGGRCLGIYLATTEPGRAVVGP